jgi:hypothetical protein
MLYGTGIRCKALNILGGKVFRMKGNAGSPVKNHWIIETDQRTYFQSYNTIIAYRLKEDIGDCPAGQVWLDRYSWDISRTTAKYRRMFLEEGVEETRAKIESGVYKTADLNAGLVRSW